MWTSVWARLLRRSIYFEVIPPAGRTYFLGVPSYGFYIKVLKHGGLLGPGHTVGFQVKDLRA